MSSHGMAESRLRLIIRAALLLAGLATYLISPDDVVWHFIKAAPHARVLEHAFFSLAAALLGLALLLKLRLGADPENQHGHDRSRTTATVARSLEAIGIGSLLPLPGFLLLALGDLAASLLPDSRQPIAADPRTERAHARAQDPPHGSRWGSTWAPHIGLCLAFLSMAVFSVVLIDRVADVLFAATAVVSVAASFRLFLSGRG
jgi:hypothetical protein